MPRHRPHRHHHHRGHHRLRRAMGAMTVGVVEDQRARDDTLYPFSAGDMAQQIQVAVIGRAGRHPVWNEINVVWPNPFLMRVAPTQADSSLTNPHFAAGVELLTDGYVIIDTQVRAWSADESDMVTGARLRVSAWSPEARKKHRYAATIHLTFFGYAAPTEDAEADDE